MELGDDPGTFAGDLGELATYLGMRADGFQELAADSGG
jgi:hypothetical protein